MSNEPRYPVTIHIGQPRPIERSIHTAVCPDCKRRSRFLVWHYEWYGPSIICLRCGREWEDGEWIDLPLKRGARAGNIAAAKKRWREFSKNQEETE